MEQENILLKSFARRIGKKLSKKTKFVLEEKLPLYKYSYDKLKNIENIYQEIYLEIGIGSGEHFINKVISNPQKLYIGCEPYLNGVSCSLEKLLEKTDKNNFLIWDNDADLILNNDLNNRLSGVYVLFPDPWHKRRYLKRRFLNELRIKKITLLLNEKGYFFFASDIDDYFESVKNICLKIFPDVKELYFNELDGYVKTKYHKKAEEELRSPRFLLCKK